jgi:hypothetical protein
LALSVPATWAKMAETKKTFAETHPESKFGEFTDPSVGLQKPKRPVQVLEQSMSLT